MLGQYHNLYVQSTLKYPMLDFWKKIQHWSLMLTGAKHRHIGPTFNFHIQLTLNVRGMSHIECWVNM